MDCSTLSIKKVWRLMLNRLTVIVALGFCLAFSLPQMANAKFINFDCELYGEEGIASDLWRIDTSQKIAIHEAGSQNGKIRQYGLKFRVDEVSHDGIIFSIRLFDEHVSRAYGFDFPSLMLKFVKGDVNIIERYLGRRLNQSERQAVEEISTKLYQTRIFVIIDFLSLQITHYSPPVSFDLSKTDKIFNVKPFESSESINKGKCVLI